MAAKLAEICADVPHDGCGTRHPLSRTGMGVGMGETPATPLSRAPERRGRGQKRVALSALLNPARDFHLNALGVGIFVGWKNREAG